MPVFFRPCLDLEGISPVAIADMKPEVEEGEPHEPIPLPLPHVDLFVAQDRLFEVVHTGEDVVPEGDGNVLPREREARERRTIVDPHRESSSPATGAFPEAAISPSRSRTKASA